MGRGADILTKALNDAASRKAEKVGERQQVGDITRLDPLTVKVFGLDYVLTDDDIVLSQWVRAYKENTGLKKTDNLVLHRVHGQWYAVDVVSETLRPLKLKKSQRKGTVDTSNDKEKKQVEDEDAEEASEEDTGHDWGIVEALPVGALVGDVCTFKAAATVFWRLTYTGEATYPWAYIGGPPLAAASNTERTLASITEYTSLATDPLTIAVPLKGDYDIRIEASIVPPLSAGALGWLSYAVGATAASDNWAAIDQVPTATAQHKASVGVTTRQTAVAAAASIIEKAKCGGAYTVGYTRRRLTIFPVRLG